MPHLGTYTQGGVTYDAHSGLPVEVNEGPSSIASEKPVGVLDGSVVRNKNGTIRNYNVFGQTKPYELWSNEDGSSWSIREPVSIDGGTGLFPSEITKSEGTTIVRDGVKTEGYENFLSDELYNKATNTIKTKIKVETLNGVDSSSVSKVSTSTNNDGEKDEENQDAGTGTNFDPPEFGRVDAILTKLSLRGLKYPIDADYGNTQDYIQINQFTFKPPSKGIFFPDGGTTSDQVVKTLTEGVPTGTPKEKALGLVKLPMPNSLADSNNVSWGPDQLNALTAAFAQGAIGVGGDFLRGLDKFLDKNQDVNNPFVLGGNAISAITSGSSEFVGRGFKNVREAIPDVISNQNINTLARGVLGSTILSALQFQVSPEALLARGQGIIPNNNLALLFNSPTLREFTFAWKMSPRSKEEAIRVNNILRFFKQGMAPKKQSNSTGGGRSFFLGTPNVFDIHFKTTKRKANFFNSIDRNDSVLRIKTCACTGAAVSYTPEGMWNAYEDGQPVAITLTLRFAELEPIFDTDYDENDLNFDPDRPDLLPVPIDAVGY